MCNWMEKGLLGQWGAEENDAIVKNSESWKKLDGLEYRPCLDSSRDYRRSTQGIVKDKRKYLIVVVPVAWIKRLFS